MWLAYTIGALLVLGGIAVIGTLLWRRGPNGVETLGKEPRFPVAQEPSATADQTTRDPATYRQSDAQQS